MNLLKKRTDLLLDEPCPELLCCICLDVLEDPMQVHCPEDHMFCSVCIREHLEKHDSCPVCLTPLDKQSFQFSKFAQRQLSRIRIKCLYAENGCPWQGILSDNHIEECNYKSCVCPNAENGCTETLSKANMDQHLENCPYSIIQCPNNMPLCQPFLRKDISKHENECQSYTCPYASEGCPFMGTLYQVNNHCDNYCGRLHKRVEELENECKRLNKLINDYTLGLNMKLPSTPETIIHDDQPSSTTTSMNNNNSSNNGTKNNNKNNCALISASATAISTPSTTDSVKLEQVDTAMSEINLFSQMFNNDPFNVLDLSTTTTPTTNAANTNNTSSNMDASDTQKDMMDLTTCLPELSFLDPINFDSFLGAEEDGPFSFITAPTAISNTTTTTNTTSSSTVPKRTVNGKRIRYSKNTRLAHNVLRLARQRTASTNTLNTSNSTSNTNNTSNPTNDAILHNLDIAKQKASQQSHNFKDLDDVTKFLNTTTTNNSSSSTATATTTSSQQKHPSQQKKKNASSPEVSTTVSSPPSTSAPKRKPMFILASSYLSNYSNASSNNSGDK